MRQTIAAAAAIVAMAGPAPAELGGSIASVRADGSRMRAPIVSQSMRGYARHDLTRSNGGTVREFTNAQGQVFAVTWSGPGKPDLRAVLGRYFATFQAAGADRPYGRRMLRRPPTVDQADLQIQSAGHMGFFHGVAFIPSLAPAGVSAADLPSPQ